MSDKDSCHSYEEIRALVLQILLGKSEYHEIFPSNFSSLEQAVADCFEARRNGLDTTINTRGASLSYSDKETFREVFWDLFLQRIITLGSDDCNSTYPHFRLTRSGKKLVECESPYFFHDVTTFEGTILSEIPNIDETTLLYLKEAMQAFLSGCILSATVMLGVATESAFEYLLETIASNKNKKKFNRCLKERRILGQLNAFSRTIQKQKETLPGDLIEGLDIQLTATMNLIREFRNDSGHPSGKIISREQCYTLLHLFIPCCKKIYALIDHYGIEPSDESTGVTGEGQN